MSYFEETSICSVHEYRSHINDRLDLSKAQEDELMMLMVLLNGIHEAAKLPTRLIKKTTSKGLLHVEVALIDKNLNTRESKILPTQDDFLIVQGRLNLTCNGERSNAVECYARDYFEDQMPPSFRESTALELIN